MASRFTKVERPRRTITGASVGNLSRDYAADAVRPHILVCYLAGSCFRARWYCKY